MKRASISLSGRSWVTPDDSSLRPNDAGERPGTEKAHGRMARAEWPGTKDGTNDVPYLGNTPLVRTPENVESGD